MKNSAYSVVLFVYFVILYVLWYLSGTCVNTPSHIINICIGRVLLSILKEMKDLYSDALAKTFEVAFLASIQKSQEPREK